MSKLKSKTKPGPPPLYDLNRHPVIIRNATRAGLTVEQTAAEAGVSRSLLFNWAKRYPEVAESLKEGREYANGKVVDSLFKRATGYEFIETEATTDTKGSLTRETTRKTRKHFPADVKAAVFWLTNRAAEKWKNKQNHEIGGVDGNPIKSESVTELKGFSSEKLRALEALLSSES